MLTVVRGAGLVFLNNPNNPTATVHGLKTVADFVERVRRISPDTVIDRPGLSRIRHGPGIPDGDSAGAVDAERVRRANILKAFGMAGMRIGYAIGSLDTVKPMARVKMPQHQRLRHRRVDRGARRPEAHRGRASAQHRSPRHDDQGARGPRLQADGINGNFIFVDVGQPAATFRAACARQGVNVGRDFPPFEGSHARISIGTKAEMERATVFRDVLRPVAPVGGGGGR